jgi:hypothetical protein
MELLAETRGGGMVQMEIDGWRASPTVLHPWDFTTALQVSARINTEMRAGGKTPMRGSARDLEVFS